MQNIYWAIGPTKAYNLPPIQKKENDSKKPNPRPKYTVRPIHTPLEPAGQSPPRSRASRRDPRRRPASPPRSRVASLPSREKIDSTSFEVTPRRKGQMALLLARSPYGDIKCQPLLRSARVRRRQASIPHSGCDWSLVRQLRSLLRHFGRCGATWEPAMLCETCSALLQPLCCQLPILPSCFPLRGTHERHGHGHRKRPRP